MVDVAQNLVIRTVADDILDFVGEKKRVTLVELAEHLKISVEVLDKIVEFFVESGVLDWDYVFTDPYVVLHEEAQKNLVGVTGDVHSGKNSQFIDPEFLDEIGVEDNSKYRQFIYKESGSSKKSGGFQIFAHAGNKKLPRQVDKVISKEETGKLKQLLEKIHAVDQATKGSAPQQVEVAVDDSLSEEINSRVAEALKKEQQRTPGPLKVQLVSDSDTGSSVRASGTQQPQQVVQLTVDKDSVHDLYNESDTLHVHELVDMLSKNVTELNLPSSRESLLAMWIYFSEHGIREKNVSSVQDVISRLDTLYGQEKQRFHHIVDTIHQKIMLASRYMLESSYILAINTYKEALELHGTLSDFFAYKKSALRFVLMQFYSNLALTMLHQELHATIHTILVELKRVLPRLSEGEAHGTLDRHAVTELLQIFWKIPSELFGHKLLLCKELVRIYGSEENMTLAQKDKAIVDGYLSRMERLLMSENLVEADDVLSQMWGIIPEFGCIDEESVQRITSILSLFKEKFSAVKHTFERRLKEANALMSEVHAKLEAREVQHAFDAYHRLVDIEARIPDFFHVDKKRLSISVMHVYAKLSERMLRIEHDDVHSDIKKHMSGVLHEIDMASRSGKDTTTLIKDVVPLMEKLPPELFDHALILSKQLASMHA